MEKDELKDGELISMLRLRGIKPSQIFKAEEVLEDDDFKKKFETEIDYRIWLKQEQIEEEDNKDLQRQVEEEKLESKENELIPGSENELSEEEKKRQKENENELIPDVDSEGDSNNSNDLIPE